MSPTYRLVAKGAHTYELRGDSHKAVAVVKLSYVPGYGGKRYVAVLHRDRGFTPRYDAPSACIGETIEEAVGELFPGATVISS